MRVLPTAALAIIGICLIQANSVQCAPDQVEVKNEITSKPSDQNKILSQSAGSISDIPLQDVKINKSIAQSSIEIITSDIEKILRKCLGTYKAIRTSVITKVNEILKVDIGVWVGRFEEAVLNCGKARRRIIVESWKMVLRDALRCVEINGVKVDDLNSRGLKAIQILRNANSYFKSRFETCMKKEEILTASGASDIPHPRIPNGDKLRELTCLATATDETLKYVQPVPGFFYSLGKMIATVFNKKQMVAECFQGESQKHLSLFVKTAKLMAVCVAYSF